MLHLETAVPCFQNLSPRSHSHTVAGLFVVCCVICTFSLRNAFFFTPELMKVLFIRRGLWINFLSIKIWSLFTNKKEKKREGFYVYMDQHYIVILYVSEKQFLSPYLSLMPHLNQLKCENFTVSDFEPHPRLEKKKINFYLNIN